MCDYCGCDSIETIKGLMTDHNVVHDMSRSLQESIDRGDYAAAEAVRPDLRAFLLVHGLKEEAGVYPELAKTGIPDRVEMLTEEHEDTDSVLSQPITDEVSAERVQQILRNLHDHIHEEEHDLFPWAYKMVDPRAWEAADARIQTALADFDNLGEHAQAG